MADAGTSIPRWMHGVSVGDVPLKVVDIGHVARSERLQRFSSPAEMLILHRRHNAPRRRPALSALAAAFLALVGLITLSAAGFALPERGLTVTLPDARPFSELFDDRADGEALPVTLTEAEQEAIRAAIAADLAGQSGYQGPVPSGMAFRAASNADRERALLCMTQAIYYEAGTESEAGQRAVAQVVLNRVRHPAYANSICGVVYEGSERSTGCQFTFTCDGALARRPLPSLWAQARRYAREAIGGRQFRDVGYATHYHTLDIWPYWGRSLTMTNMIGRHLFHRLRGSSGSPGAFTVHYAGREPAPRPWLPRVADTAQTDTEVGDLANDFAASGDRLPAAPVVRNGAENGGIARESNNLPSSRPIENALPDSQIRPEYRDSGRWIGS